MATNRRLQGKVAIVTGAGSGIGRGAAIVLAKEGAEVVVVNDKNIDAGKETERLIKEVGGEATFVRADVRSEVEVSNIVACAEEIYGGLDIMFANAGVTDYRDLVDMSKDDIARIIDINLMGSLLCAKYAIPAMKKRGGGSIVFCSSVLNRIGFPQAVVYGATKAGQVGAVYALASEVGKDNIRVNCISPGTTNTPMVDRDPGALKDPVAYKKMMAKQNPLGRIAEPEDIGKAVAWISSDEASFITGQDLYIDGGFTSYKRLC